MAVFGRSYPNDVNDCYWDNRTFTGGRGASYFNRS